ncbi:MAG: glycosyltransferase family 39 protein [Leptospirales bacterium]|nr:glycosyltransferase family 39 protein [Leptospirales bacterium]
MKPAVVRDKLREHRFLLILSVSYFVLQYALNAFHGFGYFTDEMYYLACAARPAAGYVDQPPMSIWILRLVVALAGDSLPAIRLLPALAGGATVFLTGLLARRLGGNALASILAGLCVIASPVLMVLFGFYSMNSFEVCLWTAFTLTAVKALTEDRPKLWLLAGLIAGLGLENKHTMGVYAFAFFSGLPISSERKHFKSPWVWIGGALAGLLLLPNLVWQMQTGWQSLEFYRNADAIKNLDNPAWKVMLDQILSQNPMSVILWLPGLFFLLLGHQTQKVRAFGWAYLILLAVVIVAHSSRPDRIAAAYPILFASGACFLVRLNRRWPAYAVGSLLILGGAAFAPAGLPVLSPDKLAAYAQTIGVIPQIEKGDVAPMPMWFGNRFDWDRVYESVRVVYDSLPANEKSTAVVYTGYYTQAGAIERFGRGSIPVISGHNNYYLWGKDGSNWNTVIALGVEEQKLSEVFAEVHQVGSYSRRFTNDTDVPIYLCRQPRLTRAEMWRKAKVYL